MSIEKNINARIQHKHDIEANWIKAVNFIPKKAELIVYDIDANYDYERLKIGDGATPVTELPFAEVQADWNQNDETAADFIKNRPFGIIGERSYEPITITWDGDTTDKVSVSFPPAMGVTMTLCKVSDLIPSLEHLQIGSSSTVFGENEELGETEELSEELNFEEDIDQGLISASWVYIATKDNAGNENLSLPEKGIYFMAMTYNGMSMYVKNLTISGGSVPIIQKIDSKYLPVDEIIGSVKETAETAKETAEAAKEAAEAVEAIKETAETAKKTADAKMDKINPTGTGTFSLNAKNSISLGTNSFTEGFWSASIGAESHAEGHGAIAKGQGAHAEGYNYNGTIKVTGIANSTTYTVLEHNGHIRPGALIIYNDTVFSNITNYDQATLTITLTSTLSAEEDLTEQSVQIHTGAFGTAAHAEGHNAIAYDHETHAEGYWTSAFGTAAHAEGYYTIANGMAQHAQGKYNIKDVNYGNKSYAHVVGNGTSEDARSNAHTLDWNGNAWYQGDVYVGSTSGTNKDEGSKKLATEEFVNNKGYLTSFTETDPTVPIWAKSPTKPTYTASEVGAYSKTEIDDMVFITVDDIDAICVKIEEVPVERVAGLYKIGTNFGELIYTWDELIEKDAVKQDDTGRLYYFQLPDDINREGDVIISDTVTLLACQCLAGGVSSDTIIIPSSVTTIEDNVFESVKNIIIPASVTTIDCTAFSLAGYMLENIYYEGSQAQWKNIDPLHYSCFDEDECGGINTYDATIHYNYTE